MGVFILGGVMLEVIIEDTLFKYKNVLIKKAGDIYIFTISPATFKFNSIELVIGIIDELS